MKTARILLALLLLAVCSPAQMQDRNSTETLKQYVADLQRSPDDRGLREKIIRLALGLRPRPATPDAARRAMVRGQAAFEGAKSEADYREAAGEFQQAANSAPWWGEAYYNLAIAHEKSGSYDSAMQNLQLYLLTEPSDTDAAAAKDLMYKIEYRKDKTDRKARAAARAREEQAAAARRAEENFLPRLNGATFLRTDSDARYQRRLRIQRNMAILEYRVVGYVNEWSDTIPPVHAPIEGHQFRGQSSGDTYTISDDGETIKSHVWVTGPPAAVGWWDYTYTREH